MRVLALSAAPPAGSRLVVAKRRRSDYENACRWERELNAQFGSRSATQRTEGRQRKSTSEGGKNLIPVSEQMNVTLASFAAMASAREGRTILLPDEYPSFSA